jgi:hypothetical protein
MADALLSAYIAELAGVQEQLEGLNAKLFADMPPSGQQLQLMLEERKRLIEETESLDARRDRLVEELAASALAPPQLMCHSPCNFLWSSSSMAIADWLCPTAAWTCLPMYMFAC